MLKLNKQKLNKKKNIKLKISFINFLSGKKRIKKKILIGKCIKITRSSLILNVSRGAKFSCEYRILLKNPSILNIEQI